MINIGDIMVSVADVTFFDPVTGDYMGEGLALQDSSLVQECQSIEQRGGYLNGLLFNIKHSKNVSVNLESATFKMEYLAFQAGSESTNGQGSILKQKECVSFTNGVGNVAETPTGKVWVRLSNGTVTGFTPTGKSVNIADATFNGQLSVIYAYQGTVEQVTLGTKTQPFTVKAIMKVHAFSQEEEVGMYEIEVPLLKFDGSINLNFAADTASTFGLGGTALEYTNDCGEGYYATVKFISNDTTSGTGITSLAAQPGSYTLSLAGTSTATAQIIGVRNNPFANVSLNNADVTFATANLTPSGCISVNNQTGVITATAAGTGNIVATYQGLQTIIGVTVTA